jgi:hypothetical protein
VTEIDEKLRCPHCPDGHGSPFRGAWAVWVASDRDGDGQPTHLIVTTTEGTHVAEEDAEWLRQVIREWKSRNRP